MNDEQHAYWEQHLRFLADQLMLRDWDIRLDRDRPRNTNAWAEIWVNADAKSATISLSYPEFFTLESRRQNDYCLHELIHCHWNAIDARLNEYKKVVEGGDAWKLLRAQVRNAIEIATDDIARAFNGHLAQPEF